MSQEILVTNIGNRALHIVVKNTCREVNKIEITAVYSEKLRIKCEQINNKNPHKMPMLTESFEFLAANGQNSGGVLCIESRINDNKEAKKTYIGRRTPKHPLYYQAIENKYTSKHNQAQQSQEDKIEDVELKNKLRSKYANDLEIQNIEIDIILPTYNRGGQLANAISSVQNQIHQKWKLYVCDDGSNDNTIDVLNSFQSDQRIQHLKLEHRGVSSARNTGMNTGNNEIIAFLDSDNSWHKEYLNIMLAFFKYNNLSAAYCRTKVSDGTSDKWIGENYDWRQCVRQNYIDINCFMIRRKDAKKDFDEDLQRFVDWDFILGNTLDLRTAFLPVTLVQYDDNKTRDRITTTVYQGQAESQVLESIRMKHSRRAQKINNLDAKKYSLERIIEEINKNEKRRE